MSSLSSSLDSTLLPTLTNMIRVETAVTRFPLHRLAKVAGEEEISIEEVYLEDDVEKKTIWKVRHRPGPLAYKVETLVINRRIDETGRPIPKVLALGSLREIGRLSSLGNNTEKVKEALRQNAFAAITAKFRYTTKTNRKRYVEVNFTRYKVVFAGEELPDGSAADQVFIIFDDDYLKIINTAQNRPLDYDFLRLLPPMAQRFYELFSFHMFAALHNKQPTAKMLYSDFCKYAPQSRQHTYEAMTKQMYKVHRHHLEQGYIDKVSYLPTRTSPPDWWMIYEPGERARHEYHFSQGNLTLPSSSPQTASLPTILTPLSSLPATVADSNADLSEEQLALFKELATYGVKDKIALDLVLQYPERVRQQIDVLPLRQIKKTTSGFLIKSIREDFELPMPLLTSLEGNATSEQQTKINSAQIASNGEQSTVKNRLLMLQHSFETFSSQPIDRELQFVSQTVAQSLALMTTEINALDSVSLGEIENRLQQLENLVHQPLLRLSDENISQQVADSLKAFRGKMSQEKFQETAQTLTLKHLRDKYQLPTLSLFTAN